MGKQYYYEVWDRFGWNKIYSSDGYTNRTECEKAAEYLEKDLKDAYTVVCEAENNYTILPCEY